MLTTAAAGSVERGQRHQRIGHRRIADIDGQPGDAERKDRVRDGSPLPSTPILVPIGGHEHRDYLSMSRNLFLAVARPARLDEYTFGLHGDSLVVGEVADGVGLDALRVGGRGFGV